jgi:hypothetical protein
LQLFKENEIQPIKLYLVHIGCGRKFTPYSPEKNSVILALSEGKSTLS